MLYKDLPFHIKSVSESNGVATFEGYAAVFNNIDRAGDIILPGAFKDTLSSFLKDGLILWQHKSFMPIGKPLEAYEDAHGLFFKAEVLLTIPDGKNAAELMKAGIVKRNSIGYNIADYEVLDEKNIGTYAPNATPGEVARAVNHWGLALKKLDLLEVSPVSIPCNPLADITGIKNAEGLRFDEHLMAGLAAVRGVKARAAEVHALRAQDGRTLSKASRETLEQLMDAMNATTGDIRALLDVKEAPTAPEPTPKEEQQEQKSEPAIDSAELLERIEKRRARLKNLGINSHA
jgi:HK97 family phage prohead protease